MQLSVGEAPYSKYAYIYKDLLALEPALLLEDQKGWIKVEDISRLEAKRIYEAVRLRCKRHQWGQIQSRRETHSETVTLWLRRVIVQNGSILSEESISVK